MSTAARSTPRSGWFKSSFSKESTSCVEVKFGGDTVLIRDSKYLRDPANDPAEQPIIAVSSRDWPAFLGSVTGQISAPRPALPRIHRTPHAIILRANGATLTFTRAEWTAFTEGIAGGEFAAA